MTNQATPAEIQATEQTGASEHEPTPVARPEDVPIKFWDAEQGSVRVEALSHSYRELERKLGGMIPRPDPDAGPEARAAFHRALGVPEQHQEYAIDAEKFGLARDPALDARLHAAGLTNEQASLVYQLAAEVLNPALDEIADQATAERDVDRLVEHFGGQQRWDQVAQQVETWGRAKLPAKVLAALSGSYEGVLAMQQMMNPSEPSLLRGAPAAPALDETVLRKMMNDPRYWRDKDPDYVNQVTDGYRRLYPS